MKLIKNFALVGLLLAACIPTETKPYGPSAFEILIVPVLAVPVFCFSCIYFPYKFLTRHSCAEKFVEYQEDIETYTIKVKIKQRRKVLFEKVFEGPDYQSVIHDALAYAQSHQAPSGVSQWKEHFLKSKQTTKVALFAPCIKLVDNKKIYGFSTSTIRLITPTKSAETAQWKKLEKALVKRFRV